MAWSGSPIAVSPGPSPLISRSSSYWTGSMSWYSSTLTWGQRARRPGAVSRSSARGGAARSQPGRDLRVLAEQGGGELDQAVEVDELPVRQRAAQVGAAVSVSDEL